MGNAPLAVSTAGASSTLKNNIFLHYKGQNIKKEIVKSHLRGHLDKEDAAVLNVRTRLKCNGKNTCKLRRYYLGNS